ncbi:MotA/TolQ/ExbB proton channel family protein [Candidatus Dependentiae bacterium]|nr:MotA/TolQ/ExbB proton channel family protein [Candidatus Dependentiae bacterium]
MEHITQGSVIWNLIVQSDFITQLVMIILFGMSITCWAIALYKLILLRIKQNECNEILKLMRPVVNLSDLVVIAQEHKKTLPGYVLVQLLAASKQAKDVGSIDILQLQAESILDDSMYYEESYTSVLNISASIATLLGLFGTVWGLIHAFVRISEKQSADIVAVAPGISEALITTIAGLFVAIPALIFSQYIATKIKTLEYNLMLIIDKVSLLTRISMVQQSHHQAEHITPAVSVFNAMHQEK